MHGKSHGKRSLAELQSREPKKLNMTEHVCVYTHTHTHTQAGIHTQPILWSRSKLTKGRAARQARVGRRCSDVRSSASDWLWGNVCLLEKTAGQGRAEGQEMEETAETLESNSFKGSQG